MDMARRDQDDHVGSLDGLRGLAALWVLLSHVQLLSGFRALPVLSWGGLAVDLFMMISGFLMAHHYIGRARQEPWAAPRTWLAFWLRRLFRIAPAYYVLLAIAMLAGPWLADDRALIAAHFPWTQTSPARFTDHGLAKMLAHVFFVFGALPKYAFSTPLPDWSIGLEMQFYLVLPFLMLLWGRRSPWLRPLLVVLGTLLLAGALRGYSARFELPSFLPMKLGVFVAGIACAYGVADKRMTPALLAIAILSAARLATSHRPEDWGFVVVAFGFAALVGSDPVRGGGWLTRVVMTPVRAALSSRAGVIAGELAYGVYLIHLLVVVRLAGWLLGFEAYAGSNKGSLRFLALGVIALPVTLVLSWAVHRWIEQSGIALGKRLVRRLRGPTREAAPVVADTGILPREVA
jgi:peptidoglycan/LPS O-acetylase OafA/YrhL